MSAELIGDCSSYKPEWGIVLGSGLSSVGKMMEDRADFPYESLYGFRPATVLGHPGVLSIGLIGDVCAAAFQGRTHPYEGGDANHFLTPVRLCRELGVNNIILTNAAGALHPPYSSGCFMPVTGHLNLTFNPGDKIEKCAVKNAQVYDAELIDEFLDSAITLGVSAHKGVYAAMTGPTYETPAEAKALLRLGADAVGMSTALEALEAAALGMRVLAVSCITNDAVPFDGAGPGPSHDKVLSAGEMASSNLFSVLKMLLNGRREL